MVLGQLRDDLPFAILAPAGFFVVFHLALRNVIDTGQTSYAQYLL
ncbi:ABC transporter, partial [Mycobacterium sp. ITM-2017-0098]